MKIPDIRMLIRARRIPAVESRGLSVPIRGWAIVAAVAFVMAACGSEPGNGRRSDRNPGLRLEEWDAESSVLVTSERGGTDSFVVHLGDEPWGEVTLSVTGFDPTEAAVEPATLEFDSENWEVGQRVVVIGLDDDEWDGSQNFSVVLDTSGSSDEAYSGMSTTSLSVVNLDNDGPGLTVISGKMAFWEHGGEGHFWVVLNTPPTDTVALTVGCTDETEALISTGGGAAGTTAALQFTPSNWSTPRRVNLIGQDDDLMDGNQILDLNVSVNTAATWDTTGYLTAEPATATIKVKDGETIGVDVRISRMCGG